MLHPLIFKAEPGLFMPSNEKLPLSKVYRKQLFLISSVYYSYSAERDHILGQSSSISASSILTFLSWFAGLLFHKMCLHILLIIEITSLYSLSYGPMFGVTSCRLSSVLSIGISLYNSSLSNCSIKLPFSSNSSFLATFDVESI